MITPADLANTVTAFTHILVGILTVLFCLIRPQPKRWIMVYAAVILTGIPTVWYHGFEEVFPARVADIGTNLLLVWSVQFAALGDFYSKRARNIVPALTGAVILAYLGWMLAVGPENARVYPIRFGDFGAFSLGELVLIGNVFIAVGLIAAKRKEIPAQARPFLAILLVTFTTGLLLAMPNNNQVDLRILAWHALWHIVGALGFFVLWAFNDARFNNHRLKG